MPVTPEDIQRYALRFNNAHTTIDGFKIILELVGELIDDSNAAHAVNYVSLVQSLVEKGVVTEDEIMEQRASATSQFDQVMAQKSEEFTKELDSSSGSDSNGQVQG